MEKKQETQERTRDLNEPDTEDETVKWLCSRGITLEDALVAFRTATIRFGLPKRCTTSIFWAKYLKGQTATDKNSYVDFLHVSTGKSPKPAEVHVVHSWSMEHRHTLIAAAKAINELKGGREPDDMSKYLDIEWHKINNPINLETSLFLCTYVVNQYSIEQHKRTPQCQIDKFHLVAQRIYLAYGHPIVVAIDTSETALSRSCCLEEIHAAIVNHIPLKFSGTGTLQIDDIDASKAQAYDDDVRVRILDRINKMDGGILEFNKKVNTHLQNMCIEARREANLHQLYERQKRLADIFVFIGNPGTGKSTLLNAIIGRKLFESGFSPTGVTRRLQKELHKGQLFVDTPGLDDKDMVKKAAEEITHSLEVEGRHHIFFFCTLEGGRVRPADTTTMKLVLESAPINQYSIIVNKVSKAARKQLEVPEAWEKVLTQLMAGLPVVTNRVLLVNKIEELEDENNVVLEQHQLPPDLVSFIDAEPGVELPKDKVTQIVVDDMPAEIEKQQAVLKNLERNIATMKAEIEAQKTRMVKQPMDRYYEEFWLW